MPEINENTPQPTDTQTSVSTVKTPMIHNGVPFITMILFTLSIFLPAFTFYGDTISFYDSLDASDVVILLIAAAISLSASATGIFPIVSKIIFVIILYNTIMPIIDIANEEASGDLKMMIEMLGSGDLDMLIALSEYISIGIGAYLSVLSLLMMPIAIFIPSSVRNNISSSVDIEKAKAMSQSAIANSSSFLSKFANQTNLQYIELRAAVLKHSVANEKEKFQTTKTSLKTSFSEKDYKQSCIHFFEMAKLSVMIGIDYCKIAFSTNTLGKVIIIFGILMLWFIIF